MSARARKIEKYNLGDEILDLSWNQGKKDREIALILEARGFKISQPTISRWLEEKRQDQKDTLRRKFTEHVERELPKDLDALEEMEGRLLEWAREDPAGQAERITLWKRVENALSDFAKAILEAQVMPPDSKERRDALRGVVKRVIHWILEDGKTKADRRADMKLAAAIIEIKLRNAGVIDETDRGQINMKFHLDADQTGDQKGGKKLYKLSLVGGSDAPKS